MMLSRKMAISKRESKVATTLHLATFEVG